MSAENDPPPTAGINLATSFETAVGTAATSLGSNSELFSALATVIRQEVSSQIDASMKKFEDNSLVRFKSIENQINSVKFDLNVIKKNYSDGIIELEKGRDSGELTKDEYTDGRLNLMDQKINETIDSLAAREAKMVNLTHTLLFKISMIEQRNRLWSVKISNYQCPYVPSNEITDEHVYNTLIEPTLKHAIAKGFIKEFDTSFALNCEYSHPIPRRRGPPIFIFRFYSRKSLYAFMINKKSIIEAHVQKCDKNKKLAAGAVSYNKNLRIKASHDLSPLNRQVMTYLYGSGAVTMCKIQGLSVAFKPKGSNKWIRIVNPFGKNIYEMCKPLPSLHDIVPELAGNEADIFNITRSMDTDKDFKLTEYFRDFKLDLTRLQEVVSTSYSRLGEPNSEDDDEPASQSVSVPNQQPAAFDDRSDEFPHIATAATSISQPTSTSSSTQGSRDSNLQLAATSAAAAAARDQPPRGAKKGTTKNVAPSKS